FKMASFSISSSGTPTLSQLVFVSPHNPTKRLKLSLLRRPTNLVSRRTSTKVFGSKIKAVQREESAVLDEKDRELATKVNDRSYSNTKENERLVKYMNGNGNGTSSVGLRSEQVQKNIRKKKSIDEIGQEEAWFKRSGGDQVEVSVAPGGRWSRFKTYSTIQRTMEIWGFVLTFIFKIWLNNQK
ncbi:hypothetical protein ABTP16_17545, partial [Acinetobacter baumannii]